MEPSTETHIGEHSQNPHYRVYIAAVVGLTLLGCAGILYKNRKSHELPESFFIKKLVQPSEYDLVVVGSSRAYRGISPRMIEKEVGGIKAYNFAFSALHLTPKVLDDASKLLKPDGKKILLLEVDASTTREPGPDGYTDLLTLNRFEQMNAIIFGTHLARFRPWPLRYIQKPSDDGFVWSDYTKRNVDRFAKRTPDVYHMFDRTQVANAASWIRSARSKGYIVLATAVPTSEAINQRDIDITGFDADFCKTEMKKAGAIWLDVHGKYETYDGLHLAGDDALRFSTALGIEAAKALSSL